MKKIAYSKTAAKYLLRSPKAKAIRAAIQAFAAGEPVNAKAMKGTKGLIRIRIGNFRAIVEQDDETVTVLAIGPRGDVYK
ncbi:type II toxin-antitoxin system RelE family toxin [Pararhizobium sp.]|uniref:type II toxin-antitoxin system RelE family toxin n=1 Tax=Pararhizobium sp. TaxID=1977563 RepID=UPI003D12923C